MQRSIDFDTLTLRDAVLYTESDTGRYFMDGVSYPDFYDAQAADPKGYPYPETESVPSAMQIGSTVVLGSRTDVSPNALRAGTVAKYFLHADTEGIGGNSNHKIKQHTGWRGTTNDVSVDGHGLATIISARTVKRANGDEFVRVTVRTQ